jgi:hypothetical protein
VTNDILLDLWKTKDIPACNDGMALAHEFLKSCVRSLDTGNSSNFFARFENYNRHRNECEKCNGV